MEAKHNDSSALRYFVYDNFYDLVYHDEHRGRFGFQFEHVENGNVFYLFCEIDGHSLPSCLNVDHVKSWIENHRELLANVAEEKHARNQSRKHLESGKTLLSRYDVLISQDELKKLGFE